MDDEWINNRSGTVVFTLWPSWTPLIQQLHKYDLKYWKFCMNSLESADERWWAPNVPHPRIKQQSSKTWPRRAFELEGTLPLNWLELTWIDLKQKSYFYCHRYRIVIPSLSAISTSLLLVFSNERSILVWYCKTTSSLLSEQSTKRSAKRSNIVHQSFIHSARQAQ